MTSLFDVSVFLSGALCLLMCTASLQVTLGLQCHGTFGYCCQGLITLGRNEANI
jgi:hypothetical protein